MQECLNAQSESQSIVVMPFQSIDSISNAKLGVDLVPIHCDWDNTFPNHPPDPTRQKNMVDLSKAVVENNCEFGIGMDGDGDRIGVVDEQGRFIHPDRLMAVIAADVLVDRRDGTEAERTVFFDVKCSMALEEAILSSGGVPKMVYRTLIHEERIAK